MCYFLQTIRIFVRKYYVQQDKIQMCFQPQRQAQQGWQEVSTNIPAFYKSYQDLSFLASVLGVGGSLTRMHYFDVDFGVTQTQLTVSIKEQVLNNYFFGGHDNAAGISFVAATTTDGAKYVYIISGNGMGYSAGIELTWYGTPTYIKYVQGTFIYVNL